MSTSTVDAAANVAPRRTRTAAKAIQTLPKTSPATVKVEYFRSFFKDPPNAEELVNNAGVRSAGTSVTDEPPTSPGENDTPLLKKKFRGLPFNDSYSNQERIFITVLFLRDHLRERARPDDTDHKFYLSRDDADFRALAEQLEQAQPALKGVTGGALFSLYTNVVEKAKELDKFLEMATGDPWASTKLADMAIELMMLEEEIRERDERKIAEKEGKVAAADSKAKRLVALTFKTGGRARKSAKTNITHDISSTTLTMVPSQSIPDVGSSTNSVVPATSSSCPVAATSVALQSAIPPDGTSTLKVNFDCAPPQTSSNARSVPSGTAASPLCAASTAEENLCLTYPPAPPDAGSIPNPLRPASVSSRSLTGKDSISSRSYNRRKSSVYSDKEQETFKEILQEHTTSIMRMVQDLSTEWNQKYSALNTSVQGLEKQLFAIQGAINSIVMESRMSKIKHAIFDNLLTDVKLTAKQIKQQTEAQEEKFASLQTFVHDLALGSQQGHWSILK